jgi:CTP synthase (UTP-ammonia lyase)
MLLQIGILGDFQPTQRSHQATNNALRHAAAALRLSVSANWLPTPSLLESKGRDVLAQQDAIFASPGSPYTSMTGMLRGIEFARVYGVPFLGTCGGFQYALIEHARNVLGFADADTVENGADSAHWIVTPVACPVPDRNPGSPKLSGRCRLTLRPGSLLAGFYRATSAEEEYFCNFEVNPEYVAAFEETRLLPAAFGEQRELRAVERAAHPFFVATLFQPQLSSREDRPHPVLTAYLKAAVSYRSAAMSVVSSSV